MSEDNDFANMQDSDGPANSNYISLDLQGTYITHLYILQQHNNNFKCTSSRYFLLL